MIVSADDACAATTLAATAGNSKISTALLTEPGPAPITSAATAAVTIVIVEDHLLFADSLAAILEATSDMTVLAIAPTCAEGLQAVTRHRPDVLLLDQWLPDGLGVEQIPALLRICGDLKILVVTADDSDELVVAAIAAGAVGVIIKAKRAADLVVAIRAAARNEPVVTPEVLGRIVRNLTAGRTAGERSDLS